MRLQEPKLRTLDEEITRCLETAEKYEIASKGQDISDLTRKGCQEIATEQRQLAEWLTELKEAKRLLRLAVEDFNCDIDSICAICKHNDLVDGCPYIERYSECEYKWRYTDEALKLLGGSENE